MKTYRVSLVKSYLITIEPEDETNAKGLSELFTSDIQDISEEKHQEEYNFSIAEIECVENNAYEAEETMEDK